MFSYIDQSKGFKPAADESLRHGKLIKDFSRFMTYEQFKLVRACLHPDRPERSKEQLTEAFAIFNPYVE